MRIAPIIAATLLLGLAAGCSTPSETPVPPVDPTPVVDAPSHVVVQVVDTLHFNQSIVTPAQGLSQDLYEPLIDVSKEGTIYVAAHVAVAITTGTPAYFSTDDGATWQPLPFAGPAAAPPPLQGSAAPSGDEGAIVAGDGGHAYMADVALHSFPIEGWCNNGASQCYHNPNAYDRVAATSTPCGGTGAGASSLNDRPWATYANGTLLVSNNPGTGAVQIGVLQVPPPMATGGPITWNMCASGGQTGFIPGSPAMRSDLRFVVPQFDGSRHMLAVRGDAHDVSKTELVVAFNVTTQGAQSGGADFGTAAADPAGNFYIALANNTRNRGGFAVGFSADAGANWTATTFQTSGKVGYVWVDGFQNATGALVSWIQDSDTPGASDIYVGHLVPWGGRVTLQDASLVAKDVPGVCGDVMGSAAGPDGRAYVVVFASPMGCTDQPLSHPLSVYIQDKAAPVAPVA